MSSGSRVEGVRERAIALLRLGRLALAFFEIAFELLDQVEYGRRITLAVDYRWRCFLSLVFAVAPHTAPFPVPVSIVLQHCRKPLIYGRTKDLAVENKAVAQAANYGICYLNGSHVGFRGALERIGREQHLANQQVTCTSLSSDSLQRNFTKEHQVQTQWKQEQSSGSMMPRATALSAASRAMTFSCIFQLSRRAVSAACRKVRPCSLRSPRDPKAGKRRTFDPHNSLPRKAAESGRLLLLFQTLIHHVIRFSSPVPLSPVFWWFTTLP